MVFLNPLGRWSLIHEVEPDWLSDLCGRLRGMAGALPLGPLGLPLVPVASGLF